MTFPSDSIQVIERYDPLTGCGNLVSFIEALRARLGEPPRGSFSLLLLDLNYFMQLNLTHGQAAGDTVLRWIGLVLQDTGLPVFRVDGDEFIVIFSEGSHSEHRAISQVAFDRISAEANQFGLDSPATLALMHFEEGTPVEPSDAWIAINQALVDVKEHGDRGFKVYTHEQGSGKENWMVRRLVDMLTERILHFFYEWKKISVLAFTDPVTRLPNSLAAEKKLVETIIAAQKKHAEMAVIFLDGDNLKLFNDVSYAAGDQMIQDLAHVLERNIRPDDFVARWRMGDEFIVILPGANATLGRQAAERLRKAVEQASRDWLYPVTISAGVVAYPQHGDQVQILLAEAESALKQAKETGKNRVIVTPKRAPGTYQTKDER